jgi:hypothetical protein
MRRTIACLALLVFLPGLILDGVWIHGEVPYPANVLEGTDLPWRRMQGAGTVTPANPLLSDPVYQFLPWDRVARSGWGDHGPPLWNPLGGLGASFVGNPQSALFDPVRLASTAIAWRRAPALRAWLRLALAGLLCFGFLRFLGTGHGGAFLGAAAFEVGGFLIPWLTHPHAGAALFLPAVLWAGERVLRGGSRPAFVGLALAQAGHLLAGHPQTSLHLVSLALVYWGIRAGRVGWRSWIRLAVALLAGTLIAAPVLLPFLQSIQESLTLADRLHGPWETPLPARAAATFVIPRLFGWPLDGDWRGPLNANESVLYLGVIPWLLAPFAFFDSRHRRTAISLAVLLVLGGAAAYGAPGLRHLLEWLPGFGWSANRRLLLGVAFAGAVLGGLGLDALVRGRQAPAAFAWWSSLGVAVLGAAVSIAATWGEAGAWSGFRDAPEGWMVFLGQAGAMLALVRLIVRGRIVRSWALLLVPMLIIDLGVQWRKYQPTAGAGDVLPTTPAIEALRSRVAPGDRVLALSVTGRERVLPPNTLQAFGVADVRNFDSLGDAAFLRRLRDATAVPTLKRLASDALNAFGPRFLATPVPIESLASAARLLPGQTHVVVWNASEPVHGVVLLSYLAEGEQYRQDEEVGTIRVRAEVAGGEKRDRLFPIRAGRETAEAAIPQLGDRVAHGAARRERIFTVRDGQGLPYARNLYRAEISWRAEWGRPLGAEIRFNGPRGLLEVEGLGLLTDASGSTLAARWRPFFSGEIVLYENPHAWPRAFLVSRDLLDATLPPRDRVRAASVVRVEANAMRIQGEARAGEVLVVADAWRPGWSAMLKTESAREEAASVRPAFSLFRAAEVGVGPFVIEWTYRPFSFRAGRVACGLGILILVVYLVFALLRRVQEAHRRPPLA